MTTTNISLVVPAQARGQDAAGVERLHLFAAAGAGTDERDLPLLVAANSELPVISAEAGRRGWQVTSSDTPSRASVLSALSDPGSWVHVAAHGASSVDYLGRSGVWLGANDGSGKTDLLSRMDVVENGVRADLVLLNACALASTPTTSLSASNGFAAATLRAGAHDVVAALWPINDTAAYLWASTFYARLPAQPRSSDIADALRASMLRLRDSRAFRHPKYWASLVHLARIEPPDAPVEATATR